MARANNGGYDFNKTIGGFKGEPIKGSMLGKSVKSRGLLSNNLPFRLANGLAPSNEYGFLFPTGTEAGAVWRFSQSGEEYQDSAALSPVTDVGQSIGKILDYRNLATGNHLSQTTTTARPLTAIETVGTWGQSVYSGRFDGVDDGMSTPAFAAGTLTANMDFFCAIKRNSASAMTLSSDTPSGTKLIGDMQIGGTGSGSACINVGAAWTTFIDGVQIAGVGTASRNDIAIGLGSGSWHILEFRNLDISSWTQYTLGGYTGFILAANLGDVIICPAQSTANRNLARTLVGASVGLNL